MPYANQCLNGSKLYSLLSMLFLLFAQQKRLDITANSTVEAALHARRLSVGVPALQLHGEAYAGGSLGSMPHTQHWRRHTGCAFCSICLEIFKQSNFTSSTQTHCPHPIVESVVFDQKRSCGQQEKEHVKYMSDFSTFAFGATDFAGCPPIILLKAPGQVVAQNGVSHAAQASFYEARDPLYKWLWSAVQIGEAPSTRHMGTWPMLL